MQQNYPFCCTPGHDDRNPPQATPSRGEHQKDRVATIFRGQRFQPPGVLGLARSQRADRRSTQPPGAAVKAGAMSGWPSRFRDPGAGNEGPTPVLRPPDVSLNNRHWPAWTRLVLSERTNSRAEAMPWSAARRAGADGGDSGTICRLPAAVVMDDSGGVTKRGGFGGLKDAR